MREFLSATEFNKVANIKSTNCFAFAMGLTKPGEIYDLPRKDVDDCFIKITAAFRQHTAYHGIKVKEVSNLEETT